MTSLSWCPNCRRIRRLRSVMDSPVGRLGHCDGCRSTIKVDFVELATCVVLVTLSVGALVVGMFL